MVMKQLELCKFAGKGKMGTGEKVRCCVRVSVVGRLPDCLNGTHADKNLNGLGFCSGYTPYQGYHNRSNINGLWELSATERKRVETG
jgi:hypothetical protein